MTVTEINEQVIIDNKRTVTVSSAGAALLNRLETRQAIVAIIGLGYVGLPLAVAYAEAGFRVVGLDIDKRRVATLNAGKSHIEDISSERVAAIITPLTGLNNRQPRVGKQDGEKATGSLSVTTDYNILQDVDAVIICVPTPLSKTKDPDMSYIISAADEIALRIHTGMLIVLESTTYPGTTEELILPLLEQAQNKNNTHGFNSDSRSALVVGRDFFLAFSPERIDPGRKDWTVRTTPKVIGGVTPTCLQVALKLYGSAIETVVPVSSPRAAEMVKLLENTFRAVNIGLINEVAIMCEHLGVSVWEVIDAAKTKPFGFMTFYPGPGLGGHCIPVDPHYLAWKLKTLNYNARFIQLAEEINFGMPHYVLTKISDALNLNAKPIRGSRVVVLGVSYKEDVGDLRESPALDLIHLLQEKGANVAYHDPYVPALAVADLSLNSIELDENALNQADCVVITTAHRCFDWNWIVENSHLVVDTRNATRHVEGHSDRIVLL
ncbi:MAG: nucleotide sugar dehydrogenase [Chloroflexi bacterium]|nr:nucleotide sugar dehydrogenase [Chloroflexota bacterium]